MASDLLTIGSNGARAARNALDVTSQNIANSASEGYVRRSTRIVEVAATGSLSGTRDASFSGARVSGIVRQADAFRQAEVRRTSSDLARADAELTGLENIESAVENSGLFDAVVGFESALQQLTGDPVNASLRASALESARTLASSFNIASNQLDSIGENLRFEVADGVDQVNSQIQELAQLNIKIARADEGSSGQAVLLDQRDALLQSLSGLAGISTRLGSNHSVEIRIGGATGPLLLSGSEGHSLEQSTNPDGTIGFSVGGNAVSITSGALAGKAQALTAVAAASSRLDLIANAIASTANAAQANGAALDGSQGQPMFSGGGARDFSLALSDGSQIATAPAGASANSLNGSNLTALRDALSTTNIAGQTDGLLFDVSAAVAGRKVTRSALEAISQSASNALNSQSAVDLDQEAANLLRYQQAFQASAKIIEVASTVFDTLLSTR